METDASQNRPNGELTGNEQIMREILENTRKSKQYLKWQLYITLVLVVLPLLAMVFIVPMVLKSIGNMYTSILQ